ncbi:phosphatase PAP2 family protein [Paraferrimonas sedimenticola]|uniref:Phosphatidic acid phosphatase type 2/haloperoxidase domain-containing protein n=1 Tax=Paraferrimonas sedimenticola TaxID=375674 RepID=A0AA37RY00_9GAMM|nr:phosphatase PAP2 family protein [Paraferrimonas sedimenticola]GLP96692.1 hypothetical protein GCM10007895_19980 [Paraferrimonas sedimenticola]
MKASVTLVSAAVVAALFTSPVDAKSELIQGERNNLVKAGDWLQILLPGTAIVGSWAWGDTEGAWMATKTVAATAAATHTFKAGFKKLRPDASANNSFPSGHTSAAFSGAAYLHHRYGNTVGVVAYTGAALTGYSRLVANKHFVDDVVVGASFGVLSSLYFTEPYESDLVIQPTPTKDGMAMNFSYVPGLALASASTSQATSKPKDYRWRFQLSFGSAKPNYNVFATGDDGPIDSRELNLNEDPDTFSALNFAYAINKYSDVHVTFVPYNRVDDSVLLRDVKFNGQMYSAGERTVFSSHLWQLDTDYQLRLLPDTNFIVRARAGLTFQHQRLAMDIYDGGRLSEVVQNRIMPAVGGTLGYRITPQISLAAEGRYARWQNNRHHYLGGRFRYDFNQQWYAGVEAGRYKHRYDETNLYNEVSYDSIGLKVGYHF